MIQISTFLLCFSNDTMCTHRKTTKLRRSKDKLRRSKEKPAGSSGSGRKQREAQGVVGSSGKPREWSNEARGEGWEAQGEGWETQGEGWEVQGIRFLIAIGFDQVTQRLGLRPQYSPQFLTPSEPWVTCNVSLGTSRWEVEWIPNGP